MKKYGRERNRRKRLFSVLVLVLLCAACLFYMQPEEARREILRVPALAEKQERIRKDSSGEPGLKVHFIDVGQGDATLFESDGHFMLVDAGEEEQAARVIAYLHSQGVDRLDYIIGTHPHSDHIGALDDVAENFSVGAAILSPVSYDTWSYRHLNDVLAGEDIPREEPAPGTQYSLGKAAFTILAPNRDYGDAVNDWSVAVRMVYGDTAFVLTGDAQEAAEEDMCQNGLELRADVLKLGHHGSSTSTTWDFFDAVSPEAVVISCGQGNDYGYPHKRTMEKTEGLSVYRTDEQGTVVAESDGKKITWKAAQTKVRRLTVDEKGRVTGEGPEEQK